MITIYDRKGFTALARVDAETLSGACLAGLDLKEANLIQIDLRNADLSGADLANADLRLADLSGANLSRANLAFADLSGARLTGAVLRDAIVLGTRLFGTDIGAAADLSGVNLDSAQREARD